MAAGGSGCTSSAGGGGGGRGVNPRRLGRCVCICVRCVRGGEEGGWNWVLPRSRSGGSLLSPPGGFAGAAASPRVSPPPPASRASGGFFFTGRRECGRGRPGRGRAAELRLSHCVFCLFFSPKVPFPSVRRPAGP